MRIFVVVFLSGISALSAVFYSPQLAQAEPVAQVLHGKGRPGTSEFLEDLATIWRSDNRITPHRLVAEVVADRRLRLRSLAMGRSEFALIPIQVARKELEVYPNLRVLGLLWPNFLHALVRGEGPAVLSLPVSRPLLVDSSAGFVLEGLREWARGKGRTLGTIQRIPAGEDLITLATKGSGIVMFSAPAALQEVQKAMEEATDLQIIGVSTRFREVLRLYYPWLKILNYPSNAYPRLKADLEVPAWHMVMLVRDDVPQPLAQKMLSALYGRNQIVKISNLQFDSMDGNINKEFARLLPFHEATMRRFKFTP